MPRYGATFDENSPLLRGASDSGLTAPMALGVGRALLGRPAPAADSSHPSKGGDFRGLRTKCFASVPG